jgi:Xaa-Pro aminopeptidase
MLSKLEKTNNHIALNLKLLEPINNLKIMDERLKADIIARRTRFFELMTENSVVILPSNPQRIMSNDVDYFYRQNSDFYYLSGFNEPESVLIFEKSLEGNKFTMIVPPRDPQFETWNGRREGVEGVLNNYGADEAFENSKIEEVLKDILPNYEKVYYEFNIDQEFDHLILSLIKSALSVRTKPGLGPYIIENPIITIHKMRTKKTRYELEIMRKTCEISVEAHRNAISLTKPNMKEFELEAEYLNTFYKHGARRVAYNSIVGGGINATILHYVENTSEIKDGDLVLADCGSEYGYYAADITRTWPANGKFTEAQKYLYNLVLETQEKCIEMCKPGELFQNIHDFAIRYLSEGLIKIGLLKGNIDEIIKNEDYKKFFMHGLGHWLGMDVHDTTRINLRQTVLEPNMIFTIEPGIYIPDEEDIPIEYRGIGIRIEDDILITESGYENLTGDLEKSVDQIEKLIQQNQ